MAILLRGTTRHRAEQIVTHGPNPDLVEPGGMTKAEGFSTYLESAPFVMGTPEEYAHGKAAGFPNEGGPVIVAVNVPDRIIDMAADDVYFPLSQGLVQFDQGKGLEELCAAWPSLPKSIREVAGP